MSALLKLKQKKSAKQAEAQKMLDVIANGPESRDMSVEEKTKFDGLMGEVATLKAQIVTAKALEAEDDADDADLVAEPRSMRRSTPIGDAPAVHTEKRPYSILRAISLAADKKQVDGLEGEISREIEKRSGRRAEGFFMPTGADLELRAMMNPGISRDGRDAMNRGAIQRDLTTSTGPGGIFLTPELPLIELLRAKLVVRQLGAKFLTDMHGTWAIPRQSGKATVYWLAEGNSATISNQTIDHVPFSPKVAIALTSVSRQFLNQASVDAEQFVKEDLAETMARELDRVAINGAGTTQPLGILQNTTIQTASSGLALGANGGAPTFAAMIALESQVAVLNADQGALAYLTNPKIRGELKNTPKSGSTFPSFVWDKNEVNDHPAFVSTNVPANLTKGSVATCSGIIYGNWNDLIVAQWEGVDLLVNPYSSQAAGAVVISMQMSVDSEVRHPESFAIITDAT